MSERDQATGGTYSGSGAVDRDVSDMAPGGQTTGNVAGDGTAVERNSLGGEYGGRVTGDAVTAGRDIDSLAAGAERGEASGAMTGDTEPGRENRIGDVTGDIDPTGGQEGGGTGDSIPERRRSQ